MCAELDLPQVEHSSNPPITKPSSFVVTFMGLKPWSTQRIKQRPSSISLGVRGQTAPGPPALKDKLRCIQYVVGL